MKNVTVGASVKFKPSKLNPHVRHARIIMGRVRAFVKDKRTNTRYAIIDAGKRVFWKRSNSHDILAVS